MARGSSMTKLLCGRQRNCVRCLAKARNISFFRCVEIRFQVHLPRPVIAEVKNAWRCTSVSLEMFLSCLIMYRNKFVVLLPLLLLLLNRQHAVVWSHYQCDLVKTAVVCAVCRKVMDWLVTLISNWRTAVWKLFSLSLLASL